MAAGGHARIRSCLPSVSWLRTVRKMEGITRLPGSAAAEYQRAHPGTVICQVEGTWHAWVPDGNGGAESHGRTEQELLDKLRGAA